MTESTLYIGSYILSMKRYKINNKYDHQIKKLNVLEMAYGIIKEEEMFMIQELRFIKFTSAKMRII